MDLMDEELLEFWKVLNDCNVKYIMIGGFAVRFHGYPRNTDDMDIWIEDTIENRKNLREAFRKLEYGDFESIETMQFIPGWTTFYAAGIELDILTSMKGLEHLQFNECLQLASYADLEGLKVPFLHINHLIENKKITNRPKDQIDVQQLMSIKQAIENNKADD